MQLNPFVGSKLKNQLKTRWRVTENWNIISFPLKIDIHNKNLKSLYFDLSQTLIRQFEVNQSRTGACPLYVCKQNMWRLRPGLLVCIVAKKHKKLGKVEAKEKKEVILTGWILWGQLLQLSVYTCGRRVLKESFLLGIRRCVDGLFKVMKESIKMHVCTQISTPLI